MSVSPDALIPVSLEPTPVIEAFKRDVDRTLLRENLRLSTAQRMEKMLAALAFVEELHRSKDRAAAP